MDNAPTGGSQPTAADEPQEGPVTSATSEDSPGTPEAGQATDLGEAAPASGADGPTAGAQPPGAAAPAPTAVARRPSRILTHLAALLAGGALALGVLFATGFLGNGGPLIVAPSPGASAEPTLTPAPPSALVDGRSLGPVDAPVRIDVWADFQCPFCGLQAKAVEPTMERELAATGRARITFRDFAFLGQESVGAAVAARCAGQQDAFWTYHDLLFASQRGENEGAFRQEILVSLAQFANLDMDAFQACLSDPEIAGDVATETAEGRNLGISSTPTTIITGPYGEQRLSGLTEFAELQAALERVTDPSATPTPAATAPPTPAPTPEPTETPEASEAPSPSPTAS